ncbi:MAG TPA: replication-relaxation family protein [Candidatus Saccharimonadia bacterium]|nr:replication-relaxation family protein [Candidatus Saccharimonadia bacterium]
MQPDKPNYWREPYPSAPFLNHRLAVTELYVTCRERSNDERTPTLELFEPEPTCWRRVPTRYSKDRILRPDTFLVLTAEGKHRPRFIEIDMGTERLERIGEKVKLYLDYCYEGREQERYDGLFPRVVFLVLDEDRKQRMEEYIRKLLHEHSPYRDLSPIFMVALQEHAYQVLKERITGLPPKQS